MEKLKDIWKLNISTATEYFNILQSKYVDIFFNRVTFDRVYDTFLIILLYGFLII